MLTHFLQMTSQEVAQFIALANGEETWVDLTPGSGTTITTYVANGLIISYLAGVTVHL